jgi:hypothetical protein
MRKWTTTIRAIHNITGELCDFCGPDIDAPSWKLAQEYCNKNLGYCIVDGELISEIPCDENYKADFSKRIDYDTINNN